MLHLQNTAHSIKKVKQLKLDIRTNLNKACQVSSKTIQNNLKTDSIASRAILKHSRVQAMYIYNKNK